MARRTPGMCSCRAALMRYSSREPEGLERPKWPRLARSASHRGVAHHLTPDARRTVPFRQRGEFDAIEDAGPARPRCGCPSWVQAQPLTLAEAMRRAEAASPVVLAREAQLAAVEGRQREAGRLLFNNPSLTVEGARRRADGVSGSAERVGRRHRPADRDRRPAVASARGRGRGARGPARGDRGRAPTGASRCREPLRGDRRGPAPRRSSSVARPTSSTASSQAVPRRRAAGEDTRLDANVAVVEAERSRNALCGRRRATARALAASSRRCCSFRPVSCPRSPPSVLDARSRRHPPAYTLDQLLAAAQSLPAPARAWPRARRPRGPGSRWSARTAIPTSRSGVATGREGFPDGTRAADHAVRLGAAAALQAQRSGDRPGADGR